ncbi:hypothetical protein BDN72DRAFT_877701 [Pluteus cervinus]|uniref:Uncharacterized protein n=1 Tax=Pluteus cervinus TaxID=181527 RepID=A0ACD3AXV1_9AGAR|nr:hypothetical protein BDN72DRAFT_877701 [Pluteus cervinus]
MSISLANLMLLLRGCIPPRALGCIYESLCDAYRLPHNATEHPLNENEVTNSSLLLSPIGRLPEPDHLSMSDHRTCRYHHPVFPARESGASCGCKDYRKPHTHDLAAFWGNWNRKKLRKHWKNVRKNNGRRGKALALHVKAAISSAQPQGRVETKAYVLSPVEAGASDTEYPTGGRGLMRRHTTGGH